MPHHQCLPTRSISNTFPMAWKLWGLLMGFCILAQDRVHILIGYQGFHVLLPWSSQSIPPFHHHFQPSLLIHPSTHPSIVHPFNIFKCLLYELIPSVPIWLYQKGPARRGGPTFIKGCLSWYLSHQASHDKGVNQNLEYGNLPKGMVVEPSSLGSAAWVFSITWCCRWEPWTWNHFRSNIQFPHLLPPPAPPVILLELADSCHNWRRQVGLD